MLFSESIAKFDKKYLKLGKLDTSICTVNGKFVKNIVLKDKKGDPNEEHYKWQFIYALIKSAKVSRDLIGTEISFPKGNIGSSCIIIDTVIFDNVEWIDLYKKYKDEKCQDSLDKLRKSALFLIEFKRDGNTKKIEQIFNSQIKATLKEPDNKRAIGAYYDKGRLYLFKKIGNEITRLDNSKNVPTSQRILERFQLEITDPYSMIPSHEQLLKMNQIESAIDPSKRKIEDLDIVYTMNDENIKLSLSNILKTLDRVSLTSEEGYHVLIQMLAIKIYDEKQAKMYGSTLKYYITDDEYRFKKLTEEKIQVFIKRIRDIFLDAKSRYRNILGETKIDWRNVRHIRVACEIAYQFQRYSFIESKRSDLYQLVFYNFATKFKKEENSQFLTPIPIIDFMVSMVNPRRSDTVCDPCCGIADFLSVSYVNSDGKLEDCNLYGFDNDYNMTVLAQLNMLLNGDGNAQIKHVPDKGSITHKLNIDGDVIELNPNYHHSGNWDQWPDGSQLMKYDVILTNPPFGKGRSLSLSKESDIAAAKFYKTYDHLIKENTKAGFDLGVVFLENTIRSLKYGGRFGIVLSNSIASNKSFEFARKWLLKNCRVVAIIDLPENIFAETGVNTTIIIGYRPNPEELKKNIENNYKIFARTVENVGYVKRTSNRNVFFDIQYVLNEETFETVTDEEGNSIANEDFTKIIKEFQDWCLFQETALKMSFLG